MTVAPVFAIISNDLVSGWSDRYTQAKRHSWGVTEAMWAFTTYKQIPTPLWWKVFTWTWYDQVGQEILNPLFLIMVPGFWKFALGIKPLSFAILFGAYGIRFVFEWFEFCAIEAWMFFKILPLGESEYLPLMTPYQKFVTFMSFIFHPVLLFFSKFIFGTIPRFHCLVHAFLSTELAYITAPKANNGL